MKLLVLWCFKTLIIFKDSRLKTQFLEQTVQLSTGISTWLNLFVFIGSGRNNYSLHCERWLLHLVCSPYWSLGADC